MQCAVVLSTVSVFMGIRAPVIRVPSLSCLASEEQFNGTGYGTVTPRIRPSNDGCIWLYDGHEGSLVSLIIHGQRSINTSPLRPAPSLCRHPHCWCGSESVAGSIIFEFVTLSMHSVAKTERLRGVSSRGGRRSEMGSRSRRESESVKGGAIVRVEGAV